MPAPDKEAPRVTVVAVPLELFSQVIEVLSEMPYRNVGRLLAKLSSLKPQDVKRE